MAVYDCCNFLNENDLYEMKLNQHWDFVDKFIVLEAGETHTGLKKPFKFDKERFAKYSEKLIYKTFDSFAEEIRKNMNLIDEFTVHDRTRAGQVTDDWVRDHFQGNYLFKILLEEGAEDNDIILQSGLDEILRKEAFEKGLERFKEKDIKYNMLSGDNPIFLTEDKKQKFQTRPSFGFELDTYVYKFNLYNQRMCVSLMTELSVLKQVLPATLRSMSMHTHDCIKNAGWHFTFFDDTDGEKVLEKQRSWAHSKDILPDQKVKFTHSTKEEALGRMYKDYKAEEVEITPETHPKYLIDNLDKYKDYIL